MIDVVLEGWIFPWRITHASARRSSSLRYDVLGVLLVAVRR